MIGQRTRYSLAQFLELQEPMSSAVIFRKYGAQDVSLPQGQLLYGLVSTLDEFDDHALMQVLTEVAATAGNLRAKVSRSASSRNDSTTWCSACYWTDT